MNPLPEVIATLAVSESEAAIVGSIIDKDGARGDAIGGACGRRVALEHHCELPLREAIAAAEHGERRRPVPIRHARLLVIALE